MALNTFGLRASTDFEKELANIVYILLDKNESVSVTRILDMFDNMKHYTKKEYKKMYLEIYNTLRNSTLLGYNLWTVYINSKKYRIDFAEVEYYLESIEGIEWRNKYFDAEAFSLLFNSRMFTRRQMESSIIEAKLWDSFLDSLRQNEIAFVIAGKGVKVYRIPMYHDFCYYKYRNALSTSKILRNQIRNIEESKLALPIGVSAKELTDVSEKVVKAITFKPEVIEE